MQNPRVSLLSGGVREVRHGNTLPTTSTAWFFSNTHFGKLNWPRKADRNGGCDHCGRPLVVLATALIGQKVATVGAQKPISDFFGFIQMRDTLSTNGEHLRVAKVKSFPAIPKWMRSVNGDRNGANLKKWSVLLVCTIACWWWRYWWQHEYKWCNNQMTQSADITSVGLTTTSSRLALPSALYVLQRGMAVWFHGRV